MTLWLITILSFLFVVVLLNAELFRRLPTDRKKNFGSGFIFGVALVILTIGVFAELDRIALGQAGGQVIPFFY